jgi:hypothetical protein
VIPSWVTSVSPAFQCALIRRESPSAQYCTRARCSGCSARKPRRRPGRARNG